MIPFWYVPTDRTILHNCWSAWTIFTPASRLQCKKKLMCTKIFKCSRVKDLRNIADQRRYLSSQRNRFLIWCTLQKIHRITFLNPRYSKFLARMARFIWILQTWYINHTSHTIKLDDTIEILKHWNNYNKKYEGLRHNVAWHVVLESIRNQKLTSTETQVTLPRHATNQNRPGFKNRASSYLLIQPVSQPSSTHGVWNCRL